MTEHKGQWFSDAVPAVRSCFDGAAHRRQHSFRKTWHTVGLLAWCGLLIPGFSLLAQAQNNASPIAASEAKVKLAVAFLDKAWTKNFKEMGRSYASPRVQGYNDSLLTACGMVSGMNAYTCALDNTISYHRSFAALLMVQTARALGTDGDMGPVFLVAHEWGHAVQFQLGLDYSKAVDRVESDADCLAAAAVAGAKTPRLLQAGDLAEVEYALGLVGDEPLVGGEWGKMIETLNAQAAPGSVPVLTNALGSHGNARERVAAFHRGMRGGTSACLLGIPLRPGRHE